MKIVKIDVGTIVVVNENIMTFIAENMKLRSDVADEFLRWYTKQSLLVVSDMRSDDGVVICSINGFSIPLNCLSLGYI